MLVEGTVETFDTAGVLSGRDGLPSELFMRDTPFTAVGEATRALAENARPAMDGGTLVGLHALTNTIADKISYTAGATTTETLAEEAVRSGSGVCQDHAHIFIAYARVLGIPARYVSGYILAGQGNDSHVASHAWAETSVPELGWVSFDPSNRGSVSIRQTDSQQPKNMFAWPLASTILEQPQSVGQDMAAAWKKCRYGFRSTRLNPNSCF